MGYFYVLLETLDYNNKVDFNTYYNYWVSWDMIKVIRKKFKEAWLIKKFWKDFYINPDVAVKWQNIPLYVIELFKI